MSGNFFFRRCAVMFLFQSGNRRFDLFGTLALLPRRPIELGG